MSRSAKPAANESEKIRALNGEVTVLYDDRAVPHIFATTEHDAYQALGYVVARDRLFQLYLQTMAASGRLSEVAGPRALPLDREMRGLGIPAAAEAQAERAKNDSVFTNVGQAYSDGVNAYIDAMPASAVPIEFRLTGTRPERWAPINAFYLLGRMGWTLAYNDNESERYAAASRIGATAADELFETEPIQEPIQPTGKPSPTIDTRPLPPPGKPDTTSSVLAAARDAFMPSGILARAIASDERPNFASNNWAVSPKRSANGHALLAGDPHLELTLPSIWYEAHLVVPGKLDVYGATIPGAPFIVIGFNRDVAWSVTNTSTDVLDLYEERVDDAKHPGSYFMDGSWQRLSSRIEVYRDQAGRVIATDTQRYTYRGPMKKVGNRWISMRWTVLEAGREQEGFLGAQKAKSVAELQAVMGRFYQAPAQNLIAADREGHIGIRSTGRFPMRPKDGRGDVIRDGSLSMNDWRGDVPLASYPQAFDPPQGFLASANQMPIDPSTSQYWWGGSYDPWRALRINQLLRSDSSVTTDDMRAFQTDPGSARAALFMSRIMASARKTLAKLPTGATRKKLDDALYLLSEWDERYVKSNRRSVLFEEVLTEIINRTWDELLPDSAGATRRVATPSSAMLIRLMADSTSIWWDDRRTPMRETRDDIIAQSLITALNRLTVRLGHPGDNRWRWDEVRFANINHLLRLPAFSALKIPVQSGPGTLAPSSGTGSHGPSWRMVVDLGPEIRAWTTYPGGQSGNPLSDHYRDRIDEWTRGELEPVRFPTAPNRLLPAQTSATLTLRPR